MTKAELIKALEGLPDDTELYVPSIEFPGDLVLLWYVQVDCDGSNGDPEVELIGQD